MFQVESEYLDAASGFHVIRLKSDSGARHILQIAIGHHSCHACGHVRMRNNLDTLDPEALTANAIAILNQSEQGLHEYATKHGLRIQSQTRS